VLLIYLFFLFNNELKKIGHFYRNIIYNEETRVSFLKSKKLSPQNEEKNLTCNKVKNAVNCNGNHKETTGGTSKKRNSDGTFKRTVTLRRTKKKGCRSLAKKVAITSAIHGYNI